MRKQRLKEIEKQGKSKEVSSASLMETFQVYYDGRLELQQELIDKRLKIQELLTQYEWKQLIEDAVLPSEKALNKITKS